MIAINDNTQDWSIARQHILMILTQPNISTEELQTISAPVLIIAGDRDLMNTEHTVEIYESLSSAHLAILPGETHFAPISINEKFNSLIDNFLTSEFQRPESISITK